MQVGQLVKYCADYVSLMDLPIIKADQRYTVVACNCLDCREGFSVKLDRPDARDTGDGNDSDHEATINLEVIGDDQLN